jgi:hypothetical protein
MVRVARRNTSDGASTPDQPPSVTHPIRRRVAWIVASLGTALIVAGVHLSLAKPRQGPRILADEIGYLASARYLAGGGRIDMRGAAFYSGGYSVLIAPLSKLFADNPESTYASIVFMQALLAGASVLLIAQICRWMMGTPRGWSLVIGIVAGLYPTFVTDTGFTWAESALTFTLLLVITIALAILRGVEHDASRLRLGVLSGCLGAACGALITMHNRTVLATLVVVAVVGLALLLRSQVVAAVILAVSAAVVTLAGRQLNAYLGHALWGGHGRVNASAKITALREWRSFLDFLLRLDGQSWYQVVATGGLAVISLVALVLIAVRPSGRNASTRRARFAISARRGGALIVIGVFFGLLVVSAVFLVQGQRGDHIVYGRYVDISTPLLIALGLAWLGTRPTRRDLLYAALGVATVTIGLGLILDKLGHTELDRQYNAVTTFAIVGWLDYLRHSPAVFRATVWTLGFALGALAIAFVVRRWSRFPWIPTAAAAVGLTVLFAWQLGFVRAKVINSLSAGNANVRTLIDAIDEQHVDQLRLDPSIAVVGRLHLQYWFPDVDIVGAAPANEQCSRGLTVSKALVPGLTLVERVGDFKLYRGQATCPE